MPLGVYGFLVGTEREGRGQIYYCDLVNTFGWVGVLFLNCAVILAWGWKLLVEGFDMRRDEINYVIGAGDGEFIMSSRIRDLGGVHFLQGWKGKSQFKHSYRFVCLV